MLRSDNHLVVTLCTWQFFFVSVSRCKYTFPLENILKSLKRRFNCQPKSGVALCGVVRQEDENRTAWIYTAPLNPSTNASSQLGLGQQLSVDLQNYSFSNSQEKVIVADRIMASAAVRGDTADHPSGNGCLYSQHGGGGKQEYNMSSFVINDGYGSEDTLLVSRPLFAESLRHGERGKQQGRRITDRDHFYSHITTGFLQFRRRSWRVFCPGVRPLWGIKVRILTSRG